LKKNNFKKLQLPSITHQKLKKINENFKITDIFNYAIFCYHFLFQKEYFSFTTFIHCNFNNIIAKKLKLIKLTLI